MEVERTFGDLVAEITVRAIYFFGLTMCGTVLYIIISDYSFDAFLAGGIPNREVRIISKIILFFVFLYLIDRLTLSWRVTYRVPI